MKMRAVWMLGLALLLAGASVYLARNWLENQVQPVIVNKAPEIEVTKIVVAGAPLRFGNAVRREHLRFADWPAGARPEGAFTSVDELLDGEKDRVVLRPMEINEPILKTKVSGFGGRAILSSVIDEKMRATTIRVNDVLGVAGFVLPGDHVDVMLTRELSKGNPITDILFQNVKVLGIDQDANDEREAPGVVREVTLEVTPEPGQKLVLAQKVGTVKDLRIGEANLPPEPDLAKLEDEGAKSAKKARTSKIVTKKTRVAKKKTISAVRIVRALKATSYEVQAEKGTAFSAPANSKPLDLLSNKLNTGVVDSSAGETIPNASAAIPAVPTE
jgi:pilus assembly protein CpaB